MISSNSLCQNSRVRPSSRLTSKTRSSGAPQGLTHLPLVVPVSPRNAEGIPRAPRTLILSPCSSLTPLASFSAAAWRLPFPRPVFSLRGDLGSIRLRTKCASVWTGPPVEGIVPSSFRASQRDPPPSSSGPASHIRGSHPIAPSASGCPTTHRAPRHRLPRQDLVH